MDLFCYEPPIQDVPEAEVREQDVDANRPTLEVSRYCRAITFIHPYLSFADRIALEGTCRHFRNSSIAEGWLDVKHLTLKRRQWTTKPWKQFKPSKDFLELVLERLTPSTISFVYDPHYGNLAVKEKSFPNLRTINLQNITLSNDIIHYLNLQTNLMELTVGEMSRDEELTLKPTWARLTRIRVTNNFITTGLFLSLSKPMIVTELIIDKCTQLSRPSVYSFMEKATDLQHLWINGCQFPKELLITITTRRWLNLKKLAISSWNSLFEPNFEMKPIFLRLAQAAPNLDTLRLPSNLYIPRGITHEFLANMNFIETLDLSGSPLSEFDLTRSTRILKNLKTLIIDKPNPCLKFAFLYNLEKLVKLRIRQLATNMNFRNILMFAFLMKNLRVLDVRNAHCSSSVTDFEIFRNRTARLVIYMYGTELAKNCNPIISMRIGNTILNFEI